MTDDEAAAAAGVSRQVVSLNQRIDQLRLAQPGVPLAELAQYTAA